MPERRQAFQRELDAIDAKVIELLATKADHIRNEDLSPRSRELVERMGNLAVGMFRRTADSWYQRDHRAAAVLAERDSEWASFTPA